FRALRFTQWSPGSGNGEAAVGRAGSLRTEGGVRAAHVHLLPARPELVRRDLRKRGVYALAHLHLGDIEAHDVVRGDLEPRIEVVGWGIHPFLDALRDAAAH